MKNCAPEDDRNKILDLLILIEKYGIHRDKTIKQYARIYDTTTETLCKIDAEKVAMISELATTGKNGNNYIHTARKYYKQQGISMYMIAHMLIKFEIKELQINN